MRLLPTLICLSALGLLAACATTATQQDAAPLCAAEQTSAGDGVRAARAAFNTAIAGKDVDSIAALLAPDVTLVTGTDSTLFNGRDAQLSIWREDFEAAVRAIYDRATNCVSVSPIFPIAFETGSWRGVRTDDPASFAEGIYSAKWRQTEGTWQLEAEIFSTEHCGGSFCPQEGETE